MSGASLQGGTSSSLGLISQPGSTMPRPFISSCLAVRRASHPLRYLPRCRATASSGSVQRPVGRGVGDVLEERPAKRGALLDHPDGVVGDRVGDVEAGLRLDDVVVVPERVAEEVVAAAASDAVDAVEPSFARRGHVGPARVGGVVSDVPLAGHARPVPAGLQHLGDRYAVEAQEALVLARPGYPPGHVADARLVGVQPGQQRRPGGAAAREIIHLGEPDAAAGQPVEVGRRYLGAVAAQVREPHVVGQY